MIAIQIDGGKTFSIRLEGTSKREYGMKNKVRHRLYCVGVRCRLSFNPIIAALPTSCTQELVNGAVLYKITKKLLNRRGR